jgi:TPR repeat protein
MLQRRDASRNYGVASCAGSRPFELPSDGQIPAHPCTDAGVASCERACNEDADGDACLVASIAHGRGLGGPKDPASMQAFERRACELGVALGCEHFANNFFRSEDDDELDLAREHYERACRGGRAEACARAGNLAYE